MSRNKAEALLRLENDDVYYRDSVALSGVTLTIGEGEKVALIGQSGAGKTTLLRRLYQLSPHQCAFIHQQYALVPQLTTFHNIFMGRLEKYSSLHNLCNLVVPNRKRVREIEPIATRIGLQDKLFRKVGELSGGQQQRVGIGRALYRGGSILMADEPVSSLDAVQGEEIMEIIAHAGRTVVSSLHSIELTQKFFQRIIGLKKGEIQFDLPVADVSRKLLRELYN